MEWLQLIFNQSRIWKDLQKKETRFDLHFFVMNFWLILRDVRELWKINFVPKLFLIRICKKVYELDVKSYYCTVFRLHRPSFKPSHHYNVHLSTLFNFVRFFLSCSRTERKNSDSNIELHTGTSIMLRRSVVFGNSRDNTTSLRASSR